MELDVAVQLKYSAAGIQTTSYFEGNGTQWVAHSSPPTWTFSRNDDSLEVSIPLTDTGFTANGTIVGFGVMTCDANNKKTVGWPDYYLGAVACQDINSLVKATDPTEWGNLIRSADEYHGTDASQTGWGSFTFNNYTYRGQDIEDWETSHDPSHGPAAVQPDDVDIASDT